jgi:hypothetical protein
MDHYCYTVIDLLVAAFVDSFLKAEMVDGLTLYQILPKVVESGSSNPRKFTQRPLNFSV